MKNIIITIALLLSLNVFSQECTDLIEIKLRDVNTMQLITNDTIESMRMTYFETYIAGNGIRLDNALIVPEYFIKFNDTTYFPHTPDLDFGNDWGEVRARFANPGYEYRGVFQVITTVIHGYDSTYTVCFDFVVYDEITGVNEVNSVENVPFRCYNLLGQEIEEPFGDIYVKVYDNGIIEKIYRYGQIFNDR